MSEKPLIRKYFAVQSDEPKTITRAAAKSSPLTHRRLAHGAYKASISNLSTHLDAFGYFNECGLLEEWARINTSRIDEYLTARDEFQHHISTITSAPQEPSESHEKVSTSIRRLPHPNAELLNDIRDLLAQLVADRTHTVVNNFARIESMNEERAESAKAAPAPDASAVLVTPEVIEAVAEFLFDTGVETSMVNRLRSVAMCHRNDISDPIPNEPQATERAEPPEEAAATDGTDTPIGVDTSPLVAHKTAALQDAISQRDAVYFRLRNLAAQPPSQFAYEQLPKMGEELSIKQLQVNRHTAQLEQARAKEISPGDSGGFSNRRRPGTRFSHPTPPGQAH